MIDYTFSIQNLEYFLLIFTRISCFIFIAPFFSTANSPKRVRAGLSIFIAVIVYQILPPKEVLSYSTVLGYTILVLKEGITGLLIGYGATICNSIVLLAGRIIDMESGLSMVTMMDPLTRQQASISGGIYQYSIMLILMCTNMHHFILRALVDSYQLIPVAGIVIHGDKLLAAMIQFMTDYVAIGFRIGLPIFAAILLLNTVLGILAKVAPQINMFSVGIQIKILVGLSVIFLSMVLLPTVSNFIFNEMKEMMMAIISALH